VLSGTVGRTMVYDKTKSCSAAALINSFAMTYPIAERRFYDPLIEAIEDTFRPGHQGCNEHAARY